MALFAIRVEHSLEVVVQRPHDADARKHCRAVIVDNQEHRFDRGLAPVRFDEQRGSGATPSADGVVVTGPA